MPGCLGKWWLGYSKGVAGIKLRISILMGWFYFILFFFLQISAASHFSNDLGLDSLDTVEVVMAIEEVCHSVSGHSH